MTPITDQAGFDKLATLPTALLLKHGAHCPISANARDQVGAFAAAHPDLPVYSLEVTENSTLSRGIAEKLGIAHSSPQLLLLEGGRPRWHTEHYEISAQDIESRLKKQ